MVGEKRGETEAWLGVGEEKGMEKEGTREGELK